MKTINKINALLEFFDRDTNPDFKYNIDITENMQNKNIKVLIRVVADKIFDMLVNFSKGKPYNLLIKNVKWNENKSAIIFNYIKDNNKVVFNFKPYIDYFDFFIFYPQIYKTNFQMFFGDLVGRYETDKQAERLLKGIEDGIKRDYNANKEELIKGEKI
ncbi:MAG: hypothetical protein QXG00_07065 [Candidatus Woesearchaeota archaeon]